MDKCKLLKWFWLRQCVREPELCLRVQQLRWLCTFLMGSVECSKQLGCMREV